MNTSENPIILMVEDEPDILRINARILRRRGFEVVCAASCSQANERLCELIPDLLILDVMLPDGDGRDICEAFRKVSDAPVIFLSGKTELADRIGGLSKGGDYYLTKPYDPDELIAVVSRLLERQRQVKKAQLELTVVTKGQLSLDIPRSRATINGDDIGLTSKEFALLLMLVQREDREVSPNELYESVWGAPSVDDIRTIRTHMKNLRKKLLCDTSPDYDIVSTYGHGYMFTTVR